MAEKEYFISKLSFNDTGSLIKDVFAYEFDGTLLSALDTKVRSWLVLRSQENAKISSLQKNASGEWTRGNAFTYKDGLFSWGHELPKNITKHKTFVSYYHFDDQYYRELFEELFGDLVVSKSVTDGDIDSQNSDDYIRQLIQRDYLHDTTVLIVLIGPNTKCRMHVDWEISGALNWKVGDKHAGLIGILLPTHPDFGTGTHDSDNLPERFADNLASGYAVITDWTTDRSKVQRLIETAFENRVNEDLTDNTMLLMRQNDCD